MVDPNKDRMTSKSGPGQRTSESTTTNSNSSQSSQQSAGKAGSSASQMAEDAKNQAKGLADQAKEQGAAAVNQQKDTVAQQVNSVSGAIRGAADKLEQEGQPQVGHYVNMLADQLENVGRQLRNKDASTLMRDVEDLGRRSPLTLFAGTLAAGFVMARFMKASAERQHSSSHMSHDDTSSYSFRNEGPYGQTSDVGGNANVRSGGSRIIVGESELSQGSYSSESEFSSTPAGRSHGSTSESASSGTLGGQWGAGTTVASPEITGINNPQKTSTPGTELPSSAQPSIVSADKGQTGRPTDAIGGSVNSTSPTEPKSGGNIYGNR